MAEYKRAPIPEWTDCSKFWPYRDYAGKLRWPWLTQKRTVTVAGKTTVEYRERDYTYADWEDNQI